MLRGADRMIGRAEIVDGTHVDHGLREEDARIEHAEWTDDPWELFAQREAERLEVGLAPLLRDPATHMRKEVAQRDGAITRRATRAFFGEQDTEVVIQRALDHIEDGELQRIGGDHPLRDTSSKRA